MEFVVRWPVVAGILCALLLATTRPAHGGRSNALPQAGSPATAAHQPDKQWLAQHNIRFPGFAKPTALTFGLDQHLYVVTFSGELWRMALVDDYSRASRATRLWKFDEFHSTALGVLADPFGASEDFYLFVSHSLIDGASGDCSELTEGKVPYFGRVSRVHIVNGSMVGRPQVLIDRLPASNHDHLVNGMQVDNHGDLFIGVGSITNGGFWNFSAYGCLSKCDTACRSGNLPESPLSAAIVKAHLSKYNFNGHIEYTLARSQSSKPFLRNPGYWDPHDQRAGNDVELSPQSALFVEPYCLGVRNAYDLLVHTSGRLFFTDNGANGGFGKVSVEKEEFRRAQRELDELNECFPGHYYGQPNYNRARKDPRQFKFFGSRAHNVPAHDPNALPVHTGPLVMLYASSNGLLEYRSRVNDEKFYGHLIAAKIWEGLMFDVTLAVPNDRNESSRVVGRQEFPGNMLDVIMAPGGVLIGADFDNNALGIIQPNYRTTKAEVWDISPWRAVYNQRVEFVIGGTHLGSKKRSVRVFFKHVSLPNGRLEAQVLGVSSSRIRGLVPMLAGADVIPDELIDIAVVFTNGAKLLLSKVFRYLSPRVKAPPQHCGLANVWTHRQEATLPVPLAQAASSIVDDTVFLVGWPNAATLSMSVVQPSSWTRNLAVRPHVGQFHAAASKDSAFFLFGGIGGGSEGRVQKYTPATDTWTVLKGLPWAAGGCLASSVKTGILVCGGVVDGAAVPTCALLDTRRATWKSTHAMPQPTAFASAVSDPVTGNVYVVGGRQSLPTHEAMDTLMVYNVHKNRWTEAALPFGHTSGLSTSSAVLLPQQRRLLVVAGMQSVVRACAAESSRAARAVTSRRVHMCRLDGAGSCTWEAGPDIPSAAHSAALVLDDKYGTALFLGGYTEDGQPSRAVWSYCTGRNETCDDGIWNNGEDGVDCGGPCARSCSGGPAQQRTASAATPARTPLSTCSDGKHNGDETGVDCGGRCKACTATCSDGVRNGDEEGVDCGGAHCTPCDAADAHTAHSGGALGNNSVVLRINCGASEDFREDSGVVWRADTYSAGGAVACRVSPLRRRGGHTCDWDTVYRCWRFFQRLDTSMRVAYSIPVPKTPSGLFRVRVHTAAMTTKHRKAPPVFELYAQGRPIPGLKPLSGGDSDNICPSRGSFRPVDPLAQRGLRVPYVVETVVAAEDGTVHLQYRRCEGTVVLSAIEVWTYEGPPPAAPVLGAVQHTSGYPAPQRVQLPALHRINCGGNAFDDGTSPSWQGDAHFTGGGIFSSAVRVQGPTALAPMLMSERYLFQSLRYDITVPIGTYVVRLHWAELYDKSAVKGGRVFDVLMEGKAVLVAFDIFSRYGLRVANYTDHHIRVVDRSLSISFKGSATGGLPKINGIEVWRAQDKSSDAATPPRSGTKPHASAPKQWVEQDMQLAAQSDTTLYSEDSKELANGRGSYIFVGATALEPPTLRRALIRFDVCSLLPKLPAAASAQLESVTLTLHLSRTISAAQPLTMHRVSEHSQWTEGQTKAVEQEGRGASIPSGDTPPSWRYVQYPQKRWKTPGGDFKAQPSARSVVTRSATYNVTSAGLVEDVRTWLWGGRTAHSVAECRARNQGWVLRGNEEEGGSAKRFDSSDHPNVSRRPFLTLRWRLANQQRSSAHSATPSKGSSGVCCVVGAACRATAEQTCVRRLNGRFLGAGTSCKTTLCPFADRLPIPSTLTATPRSGVQVAEVARELPASVDLYTVRMVRAKLKLHRQLPPSTLFTYNGQFPGPTIAARVNTTIAVLWRNELCDTRSAQHACLGKGSHAQHMWSAKVDQCIHGPSFWGDGARVVPHVHGMANPTAYDGHPDFNYEPGMQALYMYENKEFPSTLFYHDHALGITRLNVYLGLTGAYLLLDRNASYPVAFIAELRAQDPSMKASPLLPLPTGDQDVVLFLADRDVDLHTGDLLYPQRFKSHVFGRFMTVNGKIWPYLQVQRRQYRLRLINGCNSRVLNLTLSTDIGIWVIATDAGYRAPVRTSWLVLSPGERVEVVVDFSKVAGHVQSSLDLSNTALAPFTARLGEDAISEQDSVSAVMRFVVRGRAVHQRAGVIPSPTSVSAKARRLPITKPPTGQPRRFTLTAPTHHDTCKSKGWTFNNKTWDEITEVIERGSVEIWEVVNPHRIAHPIHLHGSPFRILSRHFDKQSAALDPLPQEDGWKDTVLAYARSTTRLLVRFDGPVGRSMYHCHALEHEDHEMMRQFRLTHAASLCNNNGRCEAHEDCESCPGDCAFASGAFCGNGLCEAGDGEDCNSCPADCGGSSSSSKCCGHEGSCLHCAGTVHCRAAPVVRACCGDGICEGQEAVNGTCGIDCAAPHAFFHLPHRIGGAPHSVPPPHTPAPQVAPSQTDGPDHHDPPALRPPLRTDVQAATFELQLLSLQPHLFAMLETESQWEMPLCDHDSIAVSIEAGGRSPRVTITVTMGCVPGHGGHDGVLVCQSRERFEYDMLLLRSAQFPIELTAHKGDPDHWGQELRQSRIAGLVVAHIFQYDIANAARLPLAAVAVTSLLPNVAEEDGAPSWTCRFLYLGDSASASGVPDAQDFHLQVSQDFASRGPLFTGIVSSCALVTARGGQLVMDTESVDECWHGWWASSGECPSGQEGHSEMLSVVLMVVGMVVVCVVCLASLIVGQHCWLYGDSRDYSYSPLPQKRLERMEVPLATESESDADDLDDHVDCRGFDVQGDVPTARSRSWDSVASALSIGDMDELKELYLQHNPSGSPSRAKSRAGRRRSSVLSSDDADTGGTVGERSPLRSHGSRWSIRRSPQFHARTKQYNSDSQPRQDT